MLFIRVFKVDLDLIFYSLYYLTKNFLVNMYKKPVFVLERGNFVDPETYQTFS